MTPANTQEDPLSALHGFVFGHDISILQGTKRKRSDLRSPRRNWQQVRGRGLILLSRELEINRGRKRAKLEPHVLCVLIGSDAVKLSAPHEETTD